MADEDKDAKTEEATPRKLEEARADGQVAMSTEFVAGIMLAATAISIMTVGSGLTEAAGLLVVDGAQEASRLAVQELVVGDFTGLLRRAGESVFGPLSLLVGPVLLVGLLVGYGQIGLQLSPKAVQVKVEKLNPISGFQKVLGPRGFMRTGLGVLKISCIGAAIATVCWLEVPAISSVAGTDVQTCLVAIGRLLLRATTAGLLVIIAISLIDLIYQRLQFAKDQRMSKKEVRDEHKNAEGDPHVRARIRQIQREMAMSRMMDDVPDATVVITNPTHYAVALRYVDGTDAAPTVLAKGLDEVALRIRAIAAENDVLVVEEPPLARALHRACDVGDAVPEDLFEAVAKVLAYVYKAQGAAAA